MRIQWSRIWFSLWVILLIINYLLIHIKRKLTTYYYNKKK